MSRSLIQTLTLGYHEPHGRLVHIAQPSGRVQLGNTIPSNSEPFLMELLNDISANPSGVFLLVFLAFVFLAIKYIDQSKSFDLKNGFLRTILQYGKKQEFVPDIVQVPNFNLATEEPVQSRPFRPKFHLTMGLIKGTHNDIVLLDKLYPEHVRLRQQLVEEHPDLCYGVHKDAPYDVMDVIAETYDMFLGQILPKRWPTIFSCSRSKGFYNSVTGKHAPFPCPRTNGGSDALKILCENVEEDILIMTAVNGPTGPVYVLQAYAVCFPSGFFPTLKAGMTVEEIHNPVPGFKKKLQFSVDRFFRRIEVGQVVRRWNWAITLDPTMHQPGANHFYPTPEQPFPKPITKEELDPEKANLRVEHQTLSRLPKTKGLVFTIKSYIYPLRQIREEGLGDALATASEGMGPDRCPMAEYKRRGEWGDVVSEYLRS